MILRKENILIQLQAFKKIFAQDHVRLLGFFGSYSRNEAKEESDIDVLIETTPAFLDKYKGFKAHLKLDELKMMLKESFNKEIDFTDKQGLIQHKNTYILDKTIYV